MEKHICYTCGQPANFQLKNGNWCCQPNAGSCPARIEKTRQGMKKHWQAIKSLGYTKHTLSEIKKEDFATLGIEDPNEKFQKTKQFLENKETCNCDFCHRPAQFLLNSGHYCCESSANKCPANREKNSKGLKKAYKEKRRKNIFEGSSGDKIRIKASQSSQKNSERYVLENKDTIFKDYTNEGKVSVPIKSYLLRYLNFEPKCDVCGIMTWNGLPLTLELHHKNQNHLDNRLENLQLLCPNCHSQTKGWRNKEQKLEKKDSCTDEEFLQALKQNSSINKALLSLNITTSESNYIRARYLLKKYNAEVGELL